MAKYGRFSWLNLSQNIHIHTNEGQDRQYEHLCAIGSKQSTYGRARNPAYVILPEILQNLVNIIR